MQVPCALECVPIYWGPTLDRGAPMITPEDFDRRAGGRRTRAAAVAPAVAAVLVSLSATAVAQTSADIAIDDDDIGGVVMSRNGPEAGVWVIAETSDFDTRFIR